jgi:hypothetical protein
VIASVHGSWGNVPERRAVFAAGIGSAALAAYSVAGACQKLVWNPLAAVPGATLGEIYTALDDAGEPLGATRVIAWSVVAVALAAVALRTTILTRSPQTSNVIAGYLALIVLAAPSHWFSHLQEEWALPTPSPPPAAIMHPGAGCSIPAAVRRLRLQFWVPSGRAAGDSAIAAMPFSIDWSDDTRRNKRAAGAELAEVLEQMSCVLPQTPLTITAQ